MNRWIIGLGLSAALTACATGGGQQSLAEYMDDAATTKRVQMRLAEVPKFALLPLQTDTVAGVVLLRGTVSSVADRQTVEALTRRVSGVKDVRNELVVRP